MTLSNYTDILLDGYINHKEYLSEHFYREYKEAKKKHIGIAEFFKRLNEANAVFLNEIKRKYNERVRELALIKNIWEREGKPLKDLEDQKPEMLNYSVHLMSLTKGKYLGHLWVNDIDYIQQAIVKAVQKIELEVLPSKDKKSSDEKSKEPLQIDNIDDFLAFQKAAGEMIRPEKIEFDDDGSHKITAWNIGKSIDELYADKTKEIAKEVEGLEQRCYSNLDNKGFNLLALNLKEVIYLYKFKNNVFKNNPDYQKKMTEQFESAAKRLEILLNDVVIPKIKYRSFNGELIEAENKKKHSNAEENLSEVDPYAIRYSTDNSIEFKGQKIIFPFDCFDLANSVARLREIILDKTVCATDLQSYPELIFDREEIAGYNDLAGWVYNIIETWITDVEVKIHNNEKTRLFTSFLQLCRNKALAWKIQDKYTNKGIDNNINKEIENSSDQYNLTLSKITNKFDKLDIKEVYEHFEKGMVAKNHLTELELLNYLKAAFELKTVPKNLFKIKDAPTKEKIYEVFYLYYKNIAGKPYGRQKEYAALLGNYFEGYKTETVSSNFSKSVY